MSAELFAITTAVIFAFVGIFIKMGLLRHPSPFVAIVSFAVATVFLWIIVAARGITLPTNGMPFFILRGVIDPGIAPFFLFIAFRRVGVAITVPIIAAAAVVSTVLSIIILKETVTLFIATGLILIVGGVTILTFKRLRQRVKARYVLIAILGSSLIGVSVVITKFALNLSDSPIGGVAITFTVGLMVQVLIITVLKKWKDIPLSWEKLKLFVFVGFLTAAGFISWFLATASGMVSIVQPIISTQALFALIFAAILLKQHEKITRNIILGTIMIVGGAALLTII